MPSSGGYGRTDADRLWLPIVSHTLSRIMQVRWSRLRGSRRCGGIARDRRNWNRDRRTSTFVHSSTNFETLRTYQCSHHHSETMHRFSVRYVDLVSADCCHSFENLRSHRPSFSYRNSRRYRLHRLHCGRTGPKESFSMSTMFVLSTLSSKGSPRMTLRPQVDPYDMVKAASSQSSVSRSGTSLLSPGPLANDLIPPEALRDPTADMGRRLRCAQQRDMFGS